MAKIGTFSVGNKFLKILTSGIGKTKPSLNETNSAGWSNFVYFAEY